MFGHTPADQGEPDLDALLGSMRPEPREGGSGPGTVMPDRTRQAMPSGEDGWVYTPDQATAETLENTSHLVLPAPPLPGCKQDPIPEKPTPAQHRNTQQNSPCDPHSNPLPAIYHPYTALSMTSRSARSSVRPTRLSHSPPLPPACLAIQHRWRSTTNAGHRAPQRACRHARSMSSYIVVVGSVPPSFTLGKGVWAIGCSRCHHTFTDHVVGLIRGLMTVTNQAARRSSLSSMPPGAAN
jgi:hypothetical protein